MYGNKYTCTCTFLEEDASCLHVSHSKHYSTRLPGTETSSSCCTAIFSYYYYYQSIKLTKNIKKIVSMLATIVMFEYFLDTSTFY